MRHWAFLLSGLIVWAAHFFLLYAFASLFSGNDLARWLTLAATLPALAADGAVVWWAVRGPRSVVGAWGRQLAGLGAALSIVAVVWQALPAILA